MCGSVINARKSLGHDIFINGHILFHVGDLLYFVCNGIRRADLWSYGVNYEFIFGLDQNYKLTHHSLYRVALIFTFFWFLCLTWQIAMVKLSPQFSGSTV